MKIKFKGLVSAAVAAALAVSTSISAFAASKSEAGESISSAASYLASTDDGKAADYTNSYAFAEVVGGVSDETFGNEAYKTAVANALAENGGKLMYTDYYTGETVESLQYEAQALKTLCFMRYDITDIGGYNLLDVIAAYDLSTVTNPYYLCEALTAVTYAGGSDELSNKLLTAIMTYYTDTASDTTMGGMNYWGISTDNNGVFVEAIAPYASSNEEVKTAMEKSLKFIDSMKLSDGWDSSVEYAAGVGNCDSTAMALRAYTAAGETEKADEAYSLLSAFCVGENQGYYYMIGDSEVNAYASKDAANALAMYYLSLGDEEETTEAETTTDAAAETETTEPTSDEATESAQTTTAATTTEAAATTTAASTKTASNATDKNVNTGAAASMSAGVFLTVAVLSVVAAKKRK